MLTQDRLKELLDYDKETGAFTRRVTRGWRATAGSTAGTIKNGYVLIRIDGVKYSAHRLAFLYITGEFPPKHIDHKNGDRSDNRFTNLRHASRSLNNRNVRAYGTSGIRGVHWNRASNKWHAQIKIDGKSRHIGSFTTEKEAAAARHNAEIAYNKSVGQEVYPHE